MTDLVAETLKAIDAADHLTVHDAGAIEAILALARKIDAWDVIVGWAIDDASMKDGGARPAVPQNDNVSLSAYLKYCEHLGLSPAGRKSLELDKGATGGSNLTALRGGRSTGKSA